MTELSIAMWAVNVSPRLNGLDAWGAKVDAKLAEAKAQGADLLVMPEYASVQWLSFAPEGMTVEQGDCLDGGSGRRRAGRTAPAGCEATRLRCLPVPCR